MSRDELFWLDRLAAAEPTAPPLGAPAGAARATRAVDLPAGADDAAVAGRRRPVAAAHDERADRVVRRHRRGDPGRARPAPHRSTRPGVARLDVDDDGDVRRRCAPPPAPSSTCSAAAARCCATPSVATRAPAATPRRRPCSSSSTACVRRHRRRAAHRRRRPHADARRPGRPQPTPTPSTASADQLATLLAAGLADPGAVAADLPLLGAAEIALLDAVNQTGARPRPHGDDRLAVPRPGRPHARRAGAVARATAR